MVRREILLTGSCTSYSSSGVVELEAVVQVSLICMGLLSPVCCESAKCLCSSTRLETNCGSVTLKERPELHAWPLL